MGFSICSASCWCCWLYGNKCHCTRARKKEVIDTRPTVQVEPVAANDHQVIINSYGEVKPLENTQLSA